MSISGQKRSTGSQGRAILEFIRAFTLEHSYAPTLREITAGIGHKSPSHVHGAVVALAAAGKLTYHPRVKRSIRLVPQSPLLCIELPPGLYDAVYAFAQTAKVSLEAVVIEAVREGVAAYRAGFCSQNVSRAVVPPAPRLVRTDRAGA